ncbi:MAG: 3-phosphoserine/phosphohydroxythreonine transaminase [Crocinitomicaceae bacterium]
MSKSHNFGAGPCILPQSVFEQASRGVYNTEVNEFNGLSILEISHRSQAFVDIMEEARALVKELLNIPDNYTVLFLQGGASLGFLISAMNMARENKKAAYVNTGAWSSKALKEANTIGLNVSEIGSSADKNFNYIPKNWNSEGFDFVHITSNNTIFGTQYKELPQTESPLVCDMSSDIFSRQIDVSQFDLIYAGAQKNLGPAGATLYIVKNEILDKSSLKPLPSYLDLNVHASKDSMFNTPPVFPVYVSMLNLRHLKSIGGVAAMEKINQNKADLLYAEIDRNSLFEGTAAKEDRSNMNVTFVLTDESKKEAWDKIWNDAKIVGLKGHRSVGGYRASMYNALEIESVELLTKLMRDFEAQQ